MVMDPAEKPWEIHVKAPNGDVAVTLIYPSQFKNDRRPADMLFNEGVKRDADQLFYGAFHRV